MSRFEIEPKQERWLLFLLAAIQFVHVLDSLVVVPLAPQFIKSLDLTPALFGTLVSSYSLAAAASGLAGAFSLDRFDRKKALLFLLAGLVAATFLCGLAREFNTLLIGRALAGACGGLIQALLFTIVGDSFPDKRRGIATGTIMSSYSVATVIGVPLALFLAGHGQWHIPFLVLGAVGAVVCVVATIFIPPLHTHRHFAERADRALAKTEGQPHALMVLLTKPNSRNAIFMIVALMFSGFTVIPYMSAYLAANLSLSHQDLATVYFAAGVATFSTARWVGRLSDRYGKQKIFTWIALASAAPTLLLTHAKPMSLLGVLVITTSFLLLIAGRGIPSLSLVASSVGPGLRGRFLSLTSSVQQASSGVASLLTGLFLTQTSDGRLANYNWAGDLSVVFMLISVLIVHRLRGPSSQIETKP